MPLSDMSGGELSLRHLPDVSETCSNASFSFQITGASENLLADEDPDDFFCGVGVGIPDDVSMAVASLAVAQAAMEPLEEEERPPSVDEGCCLARDFSVIPAVPGVNHHHHPSSGASQSARDDEDNGNTQPTVTRRLAQVAVEQGKKELGGGGTKRSSVRTRRKVIQRAIPKSDGSQIARSKITRSAVSSVVAVGGPAPNVVPTVSNTNDSQDSDLLRESKMEDLSPDMSSSSSIFSMGGVAARLMQYGQSYMPTFSNPTVGISNSEESADEFKKSQYTANDVQTQETTEVVYPAMEDDRDKPLTLSQLSPRKTAIALNAPPSMSAEPNVLASLALNKRPMTLDPAPDEQQRKKRKLLEIRVDENAPLVSKKERSAKRRLPSSRLPKSRPLRSASGPTLKAAARSSSGVPKPSMRESRNAKRVVSGPTVCNPGTGWNDDVRLPGERAMSRSNSNSTNSQSGVSSSDRNNKEGKNVLLLPPSLSSSGGKSVMLLSKAEAENRGAGSQNGNEAAAPPGPHSRSISRSQSARSQKHRTYHHHHPVPDFKAIHAALDASFARRRRRENIIKPSSGGGGSAAASVVVVVPQLETDIRMQKRKEFDERVREKMREKEREEEGRRREREEEEMREVKELRKRLVVRANEVPEWYRSVPRVKRKEEVEN